MKKIAKSKRHVFYNANQRRAAGLPPAKRKIKR
jgi:prophage maintenance system killer protein